MVSPRVSILCDDTRRLPFGLRDDDWLHITIADSAVVDFFNHVNMLYGTISEFCTPTEVSLAPLLGKRVLSTQDRLD